MTNPTVSEYLVKRLAELGVTDFFGVPGDFNFNICSAIERSEGARWIGCSNELDAAYAADGYARVKGFGAVVTTFGVGELSAVNAVAGSYCEFVPTFHIVGTPAMSVQNAHRVVHHTLGNGDYGVFQNMYASVVGAQAFLTADNAAAEIERLIGIALTERRPVYINLPVDVCRQPISGFVPRFQPPTPDLILLDEAIFEANTLISKARRAVIIGDAKVMRFGVTEQFRELVERSNLPVTTLLMGKSAIDEQHPNFIGTFCGQLIEPEARRIVEAADLIIAVGPILGDMNSAAYSLSIDRSKTIEIQHDYTMIRRARYDSVRMQDLLEGLAQLVEPASTPVPQTTPIYGNPSAKPTDKISGENMYDHLQEFVEPGDIVFCETGSISFGAVELRLPRDVMFHSQSLWMSIGWATPAAFGASIAAPDRRVVLLTGDGSHQLTAQAVGSMIRHGCNTIVFLLNNQGYTIERYLADDMDDPFNDVAAWNYAKLPEAFGSTDAFTARVTTAGELTEALGKARAADNSISYIEAVTFPHDAPPNLRALREGRAAIYNAPTDENSKMGRPSTPEHLAACPG